MTGHTEVARELEQAGYTVLPRRLGEHALNAARAELGSLLGFISGRQPRDWLMNDERC